MLVVEVKDVETLGHPGMEDTGREGKWNERLPVTVAER